MSALDLGLPATVPPPDRGALPAEVTIWEVGPRDGLQNESALVPLEVKAEFVRRLLDAGLPVVEATSFVHPRWVPQLADAADLVAGLVDDLGGVAASVETREKLDPDPVRHELYRERLPRYIDLTAAIAASDTPLPDPNER